MWKVGLSTGYSTDRPHNFSALVDYKGIETLSVPTSPELIGLTRKANSVTIGDMSSDDDPRAADSHEDRSLLERVDEISQCVSNLVRRAINIERQSGTQEEWYYGLHGQLKVVEDSIRALNEWRRHMESQQSDLSPFIRFGTSTWAYEGWQGMVYQHTYEKRRFKQECLAEYARYAYRGYPLFRTVGRDLSFYGPPTVELLTQYAKQLPGGFEMCSKVWEGITIPRFADHQARKATFNGMAIYTVFVMTLFLLINQSL